MGFFFEKVYFLKTVEAKVIKAKVIILTWYVKPNKTMAINKFQRSRLTFNFSAMVAHKWNPINTLKHSFLRNHKAIWTQISYEDSLW